MRLMMKIRESIKDSQFPEFVREFMLGMYPEKNYPEWSSAALKSVGIELA